MLISKFPNINTMEKVEQLEKQYHFVLPQQYKGFLYKYNGGETPNTEYKAGKASSVIRGFYGFGDVAFSFDKIDLNEWLLDGVIPIACDTFGNEIVLVIKGENYGKVYFCNHEEGYSKTLVGDDFKAFVQKCKSKKINPACSTPIAQREADLIAKGRGHVITDTLRKTWQAEIDKYGNIVQERVILK